MPFTSDPRTFPANEWGLSLECFGRFSYTQESALQKLGDLNSKKSFAYAIDNPNADPDPKKTGTKGAFTKPAGSKGYGVASTHTEFLENLEKADPIDRNFYEIVSDQQPICFYFDAEIEEGDAEALPDDKELCMACVDFIIYAFRELTGLVVDNDSFRISVSSKENKRSQHGVVRGYAMSPSIAHAIGDAMFQLLQTGPSSPELNAHRKALRRKHEASTPLSKAYMLDFSVYSSNRVMRTLYSSKGGQYRPLVPFKQHASSEHAIPEEFFITYTDPEKDKNVECEIDAALANTMKKLSLTRTLQPSPGAVSTIGYRGASGGEIVDQSEWDEHLANAHRMMRVMHPNATLLASPIKKPTTTCCFICFHRPSTKCPFSGTVHGSNRPDIVVRRNETPSSSVQFKYHCHGCDKTEVITEISHEVATAQLELDPAATVFHSSHLNAYVRLGNCPRMRVPKTIGELEAVDRAVIVLAHAFLYSRRQVDVAKLLFNAAGGASPHVEHVDVLSISMETAQSQLAMFAQPLQTLSEVLSFAVTEEANEDAVEMNACAATEFLHAIRKVSSSDHDHEIDVVGNGKLELQLYSLACALGQ